MFSAALRVRQIKDLKDLRFLSVGVTIDMQVLKDLKRRFFSSIPRAALCSPGTVVQPSPIILLIMLIL